MLRAIHSQITLAIHGTLSLFAISLLCASDTGIRRVAGARILTGDTRAPGGAVTRGTLTKRTNLKQEILQMIGLWPLFPKELMNI